MQQCFSIQVAVIGREVNFKNKGQVMPIKHIKKRSYVVAFFS